MVRTLLCIDNSSEYERSLVKGGVFTLDADYWARSGGILEPIVRLEEKYAQRLQ